MDLTRKLGRVHSNAVSENLASFQPTYNTATNQFATLPAATPTYDANGQLTYDGFHDYQWDADGNLASLDNGTVVSTYDALGRRVEQVPSSGASTQMVWDPVGWRRAAMNGQTLSRGLIQLPGQSQASYSSSGFLAIRHADWLGSTRLARRSRGM